MFGALVDRSALPGPPVDAITKREWFGDWWFGDWVTDGMFFPDEFCEKGKVENADAEWEYDEANDVWNSNTGIQRPGWWEPRTIDITIPTPPNSVIHRTFICSDQLVGQGSFGHVLKFIDTEGRWSFLLKVPNDDGDLGFHEAAVVDKMEDALGDSMRAYAVELDDNFKRVIIMEEFEGSLENFKNRLAIEQAFSVVYAIFQDIRFIYEKTGLLPMDLKLGNCLYSRTKSSDRRHMTVVCADYGGFLQEHSERGITTHSIQDVAGKHGLRANKQHIGFCLGLMIVYLTRSDGPKPRFTGYGEEEDYNGSNPVTLDEDEFQEVKKADIRRLKKFLSGNGNEKLTNNLRVLMGLSSLAPRAGFIDQDKERYPVKRMSDIYELLKAAPRTVDYPLVFPYHLKRRRDADGDAGPEDGDEFRAGGDAEVDYEDEREEKEYNATEQIWDPSLRVWSDSNGYDSFGEALAVLEGRTLEAQNNPDPTDNTPRYRGHCFCECKCMRTRRSGEKDWTIVAPCGEKSYDFWAENIVLSRGRVYTRRREQFYIICPHCAESFDQTKNHKHVCEGTGARWRGPSNTWTIGDLRRWMRAARPDLQPFDDHAQMSQAEIERFFHDHNREWLRKTSFY